MPEAAAGAESRLAGTSSQGTAWDSKLAYAATIFAAAFLLFAVEPLIAKVILPWFGGVAEVWAVCLVFFETALLAGYAYAHWLARHFSRRVQGRIHAALLVVSVFALPILPKNSWQPGPNVDPSLYILWLLAATIGFPFFLLSSTSPLLQAWYAGSRPSGSPYRLYALSNAGSLLALLAYPTLIEPWISNSHQAYAWSGAYVLLAVVCAAIALRATQEASEAHTLPSPIPERAPRPGWTLQLLWISLAACGSSLLLAITNHITQNVASVPFLWVLPLGLYLLSFILCFESSRWYHRSLFLRLLVIALGGMAYALSPAYAGLPLIVLLPLFCFGLFICCMFCHGELALRKPSAEHLTLFYTQVALGGALGAIFVALIAPRIFDGFYELAVALGLCAVLVHLVHSSDPRSPVGKSRSPMVRLGLASLVAIFVVALVVVVRRQEEQSLVSLRNFYGVLRVQDGGFKLVFSKGSDPATMVADSRYRVLINGTIDHGLEFTAPSRRDWPTSYYGPPSGIGVTLRALEGKKPLRVGIIGLGTGTIAAYARPGDQYTFYEINPLDVLLAHTQFHFLGDSPARIQIVPGDARLSLERESAPRHFDVLAVDAFTGDSIPVHLLTLQAFRLYFRNLKPDGVLAVHISNRYLNLEPVVEAAAARLGKEAVEISNPDDHPRGIFAATWILVGNPGGFEAQTQIEAAGQILHPSPSDDLWTDDYSSLFRVLK
jgi:SAM-dependent methyltransferase/MFS family permease